MSIVDAARDAAARLLLLDECDIVELGEPVFDPVTGTYTSGETELYSGVCHLAPFSGAGDLDEEVGGESVVTRNYRLTLPYDAPLIPKEAVATMTSSRDAGLVGRKFRVNHSGSETFQTARRLIVEAMEASES